MLKSDVSTVPTIIPELTSKKQPKKLHLVNYVQACNKSDVNNTSMNSSSSAVIVSTKSLSDDLFATLYTDQTTSGLTDDARLSASVSELISDNDDIAIKVENSSTDTALPSLLTRDESGHYLCPQCGSSFTRRANMIRHAERICHVFIPKVRPRSKCLFPDCQETFYFKTQMIEHMAQVHDKPMECEILKFSSASSFQEWREMEQSSNFVLFTISQSVRCKETGQLLYENYVCHFDSHSGPETVKAETRVSARRKGRLKNGRVCTARMMVQYRKPGSGADGSVCVKYFKSHTHPLQVENTRFQRLPARLKQQIESRLLRGLNAEIIQAQLCQMEKGAHILTVRQINRVREDLIRHDPQQFHELSSTNSIIQNLKIQEHDPVLYYVGPGRDAPVRSPVCAHLAHSGASLDTSYLTANAFVLILQTRQQMELYRYRAGVLLLLETAHLAVDNADYSVFCLVVPDARNRAALTAALLTNCLCEETVQELLSSVQAVSPQVQPAYVATDHTFRGITAARQVFNAAPVHHFVNKWQLLRAWRRQLGLDSRGHSVAAQLLVHLNTVLHQRDVSQLRNSLCSVQDRYRDVCPGFMHWFHSRFLKHQLQDWAMAFRPAWLCRLDSVLHRNPTYLGLLQVFYSQQRRKQRLDDLLNVVLKSCHHSNTEEDMEEEINSVESHVDGMVLSASNVVRVVGSLPPEFHLLDAPGVLVKRVRSVCQRERCYLFCLSAMCAGLCAHMYECNCGCYSGMCAHIHRVHSASVMLSLPEEVTTSARLLAVTEQLSPVGSDCGKLWVELDLEEGVPEATVEAEVVAEVKKESDNLYQQLVVEEIDRTTSCADMDVAESVLPLPSTAHLPVMVVTSDSDLRFPSVEDVEVVIVQN